MNIDKTSIEIENSIEKEIRLSQGIFFTKENAIDIISKKIKFNKIKTVIDTAAGSCNLLIYFAKKHKDVQFYGIEKNIKVYNKTKEIVKNYKNIHYFNGDMFFDEFDIPKCDLYIGNPPWVNILDLDIEYREKIKNIWEDNFEIKKGFNMMLGDSRGDLSQLFMYYSINNFLKPKSPFVVIMPLTSVRSKNLSSSDFRNFKNIKIIEINEITKINPFENTNRSSCFLVGIGPYEKTTYPINYFIHDEGKIEYKELINRGNNLVFSDENDINGKSDYIARQGVNTLGANSVFFFKKEPKMESRIIKRLLKSSDIKKWKHDKSYWILLPYENKKILTETELKEKYTDEYNYLNNHKEILINRKSKLVKKTFYQLFGVGDYTFNKYKVVWKGLGSKILESCVVDDAIPNQSMHCYISTDIEDEAHYLCGIINSNFYEKQVLKNCESGSKSFAQPNVINNIMIHKFDQKNELHTKISYLSKKFHNGGENKNDIDILNDLVYKLYEKT